MSVDASKGTKITDGRTDLRVIEGSQSPDDARIGIVAAKWNDTIINPLLEGSLEVLATQGVPNDNIVIACREIEACIVAQCDIGNSGCVIE